MLIEALANLAKKAGAERISLEIPPNEGGTCSVAAYVSLGHDSGVGEDEKHGRLLAALSQPLVVEGNVGELDSRLVTLIDSIEDDFAEASQALPETSAQKLKRKLKEAAADKPEKKAGTKKKVEGKKDDEKTDETSGDATDSHDDEFASGEADSL